ncbi:hypothetical protein SV7mr_50980 [Stieleria bergensis]|uniref:Uncharacterized protein n=1 Tax=Stieleria bergensis TaxID=2528025 RepID=A0A517T2E6_9BACT|nr:hypothetical protein SV7mr_50980 [Planctomycetes bacterium SV_7m_r]
MSDMIRQTDRYLDDELSDEELAELFQWVGENTANADQFARQTMIDQHTSELLCGGDFLSTTRRSNTNQQASPIQANPWRAHLRPPRRIAWVAAFATTALLLIALFPLRDAPKPTRPADAIAEITYASNAFVADRVCSVGDFIGRGLLGNPLGNYSKMPRGIEPLRTSDTANNGRDVVILSEDRRTLSLDLSAGSAVDQIRVILDASPKQSRIDCSVRQRPAGCERCFAG